MIVGHVLWVCMGYRGTTSKQMWALTFTVFIVSRIRNSKIRCATHRLVLIAEMDFTSLKCTSLHRLKVNNRDFVATLPTFLPHFDKIAKKPARIILKARIITLSLLLLAHIVVWNGRVNYYYRRLYLSSFRLWKE